MASNTPAKATSTDVAVFDPNDSRFPVLFETGEGEGVADIIAENFGDDGMTAADFPRVVIPAGGQSTAWDVPGGDATRHLTGVLIHQQNTRSMWVKKRGEGGEADGPPDCNSPDGVKAAPGGMFAEGSEGNPSGLCDGCPMNEYGTALGGGKGKACKQKKDLFILMPGALLPVHLSLPPTSLKNHREYMSGLTNRRLRYWQAVTDITIEPKSANGNTFGTAVLKADPTPLTDQEISQLVTYRGAIIDKLNEAAARLAASQTEGDYAGQTGAPGPGSAGWPADGEPTA